MTCGSVAWLAEECVAEEDARLGVSMESVWSVLGSILAATPHPAGRHTLIFMREIRKLKSKDSDAT